MSSSSRTHGIARYGNHRTTEVTLFRLRALIPFAILLGIGCTPERSGSDAWSADVAVDDGSSLVDTGTDVLADVSIDASSDCDPNVCDRSCSESGPRMFGACREDGCHCYTASQPDNDAATDTGTAGPIACSSNADCPATSFCNGGGCSGNGYCYPRLGADADAGCSAAGSARQCGCDGTWYATTCERQMAGVRLSPSTIACAAADAGAD